MARGFGREEYTPNIGEAAAGQLGTIFSLRPTAKYLTGARTIIKVNGNLVGFAFSVSWNVSTDATEIRTIDDPVPYELAPQHISVSGSIGGFVIPGKSPQAELIQTDLTNFLMNKYITIEVRDSATDTIIFKTNRAMVTGSSGATKAESPAELSLNWKAIGWQAENPPSLPNEGEMRKLDPKPGAPKGATNKGNAVQQAVNNALSSIKSKFGF